MRHRLATELRAARSLAGISAREMGRRLNLTQGTIWRIDNGETLPKLAQVQAWLKACEVDAETRRRVLGLLEEAHREAPTWSRRLAGQAQLQQAAAERERAAGLVRNFQPTVVPGLLQTSEYARAVMELADVTGEVDMSRALALRLDRQAILHEPGRQFEFIVGERVLGWEPAPGVLTAQLDRLRQLAELPTVELRVLPAAAQVLGWHGFVLYEPGDGKPPYVTGELVHGPLEVRDRADVAVYVEVWERLAAAAVPLDA